MDNVTQRQNHISGLSEGFTYDALEKGSVPISSISLRLQPAPLFVIPISPSKDKQKFLILLYSNSYKLACLYPFFFFATLFLIGILFIPGLNIYAAGFLLRIVGDIRDALSSIYKYNTFHRK
jgi:hypothetical protein